MAIDFASTGLADGDSEVVVFTGPADEASSVIGTMLAESRDGTEVVVVAEGGGLILIVLLGQHGWWHGMWLVPLIAAVGLLDS